MTTEADVKREIVKSMVSDKGYARRLEDQYGVGIFDLIIIPFGLPVFMAEVKIIKGDFFGPTPRQAIELQRIQDVGAFKGHVIPVMIGWRDGIYYFHSPNMKIDRKECFSVTTTDLPFYKQIVLYYYSIRSKYES
jgi:hypothetical protein